MPHKPDKLYIEAGVREDRLTNKVLSRLGYVPIEIIDDYKTIGDDMPFENRAVRDKNSLALAYKKGGLIKNIGRMDSGQFYLFHEMDCKYDCEYCYLQYYFQTKVPVIFVNREEVLSGIEEILRSSEKPYFHVGEVCDALAFDDLTDFSLDIAELFSKYENGTIEFRTKSVNIDNLLSIHNGKQHIIPSWTFSPQIIADLIEHKTPSFRERLEAARKCQEAGFTVGVRLDPMVLVEGWEKEYKAMVKELLSALDTKKIDYISLGTLKNNKLLIEAVAKRFPDSPVILGELFPSEDGKYRYLKFQRVEIYRKMVSWLREFDSQIRIELSLESKDIVDLVFQ